MLGIYTRCSVSNSKRAKSFQNVSLFLSKHGYLILVALIATVLLLIVWPNLLNNLWTLVISPVTVIVIGLVIEYWVIQPLKGRKDSSAQPLVTNRDWATAQKKAIEQFKSERPEYRWNNSVGETIRTERFDGLRGQGTLQIAVWTNRAAQGAYLEPAVIERHKFVIDRTGDIVGREAIPVQRPKPPEWLRPDKIFEDILLGMSKSTTPKRELPETTVRIKEVKEPMIQKVNNGTKVQIKFVIENSRSFA
jgi:hypothetical protein